jgi:hypothetical protein
MTSTVKTSDLLATAHPVFTNSIDMTITFADGKSTVELVLSKGISRGY